MVVMMMMISLHRRHPMVQVDLMMVGTLHRWRRSGSEWVSVLAYC